MAYSKSKEHQMQTSKHSSLTVENVTKLDLQYEPMDSDISERKKVEEYIRKSQEFKQQRGSSTLPLQTVQSNQIKTSKVEEPYPNAKEKEVQTSYSETKKKSKSTSTSNVRTGHAPEYQSRSVQTQTEWTKHDASPQIGINDDYHFSTETAEAEYQHAIIATPSSLKSKELCSLKQDDTDTNVPNTKASDISSLRTESTQDNKSLDLVNEEDGSGSTEVPLTVGEFPRDQASQDLTCCDFCGMPRKPFPSVEQLISEPPGMIFCCTKSQELFQSMIMDTIKSYPPEECGGQNEITPAEALDKSDIISNTLEDKNHDEFLPPTPSYSSEEINALITLKEEMKKINTKEYVTSLANYLNTYGSLFASEKITFTLESSNDIIKQMSPDNPRHYPLDDYFCPVMGSGPIKVPEQPVGERYLSGSDFSLVFPDGSGQVLYPSGNIAILIACSEPAQFTFIILEDARHNPQIQAIFLSNGHASCYHQNGRLWLLLDPCGGSYFDKTGARQKQWTWWDLSQHVHAPPFQPITLKLNPSIEIKILTQDQIFLRFMQEKKKAIFNVGSKLMHSCRTYAMTNRLPSHIAVAEILQQFPFYSALPSLLKVKDPDNLFKSTKTGEAECYLCLRHLQISNLLKNVRDALRTTHKSFSTAEECKKQLEKTLAKIIKSINKRT